MTEPIENIYLLLPHIVIAVSLVYSATRYESWSLIWARAVYWMGYVLGFLLTAFLLLHAVERLEERFWIVVTLIVVYFVWSSYQDRQKRLASAAT
jgi:hypothetical protein